MSAMAACSHTCFLSYILPYPSSKAGGSWKITDPRAEIEAIKKRNNATNYNLRPLCRIMRAWKHYWDVPISGLLIDTLAYQFLERYEFREKGPMFYDWMSRDFFDYMANQPSDKTYWLAPGSSRYVWRTGNFEYKARRCFNIAIEAIKHETANQPYSAKSKWREIFGPSFPF